MNTLPTQIEDVERIDAPIEFQDELQPAETGPPPIDAEPPESQPQTALQAPSTPVPTNEELSQAASFHVSRIAERFESQYGYKPSDETLFGWQMQAESLLQNEVAQRAAALAELDSQAAEVEAKFEQSGFSRDAGRHYVNIVKESGPEILTNPSLNRLAVAQAIGLSLLEGRAAPNAARNLTGEPVAGDVSATNFGKEADDARKHLRLILKREPSAAEIKEWIDL